MCSGSQEQREAEGPGGRRLAAGSPWRLSPPSLALLLGSSWHQECLLGVTRLICISGPEVTSGPGQRFPSFHCFKAGSHVST